MAVAERAGFLTWESQGPRWRARPSVSCLLGASPLLGRAAAPVRDAMRKAECNSPSTIWYVNLIDRHVFYPRPTLAALPFSLPASPRRLRRLLGRSLGAELDEQVEELLGLLGVDPVGRVELDEVGLGEELLDERRVVLVDVVAPRACFGVGGGTGVSAFSGEGRGGRGWGSRGSPLRNRVGRS